ncbi:NAD(P)-binding protein [Exidia glandulosa HHB12029]|uniref:NAD(P)-binding protein n=1 Tax=Exidia glandulosa HHB12029 TaxID=1314781 RepID=A0A165CV86_EXIGL|nr:NAD(P)-binding protein [Exidia glandulosa HHB12029]
MADRFGQSPLRTLDQQHQMNNQKTVLITGCSPGGIGHALAIEFHAKGCRVLATARDVEKLADLQARGIECFALDVASDESVEAAASNVRDLTGGTLDILFNNAGQAYISAATDHDIERVKTLFDTNLFGVMRMVRHFVPLLIPVKGKIVTVGSIVGIAPYPWGSAYNASKAALHQYLDTLRIELSPFGIEVVTLMTGGVRSKIGANNPNYGKDLPQSSLYHPIADRIKARVTDLQHGAMPADVYARQVVSVVLRRSPSRYWLGNFAWTAWILSSFFPRSIWGVLIPRVSGLSDLTRHLRKRQA